MQKVREMGLPKSGLPAQQRDAECPPLNSAQQFQAEVLVHLREIHLWKICRQQWDEISSHFLSQNYQRLLAFILSVLAAIEKTVTGKWQSIIDVKEAYPHNRFTESRIDLWESFWKRYIANRLGGGGLLPLAVAIDHCRRNFD
jgi:hypothetical protein